MNGIKQILILVALLILGCQSDQQKAVVQTQSIDAAQSKISNDENLDSLQILTLLIDFYEWKETKSKLNDFEPIDDPKSDLYKGMDKGKNEARVEELEKSNYFTEEFINEYKMIIKEIDQSLKGGSIEYPKGEIQPYGNDADPWTNSQDPGDNYWQKIRISNLKVANNYADLTWSSIGTENYKVRLKKIGNEWKIFYLDGLDSKTFLNIDYKINKKNNL